MDGVETIATILRIITIVVAYFVIGFGPGFIVGLLLVNRFVADREKVTRMDQSADSIKKAIAHNAQWHPSNERWQDRE